MKQISLVPKFCRTYLNIESVSSNNKHVQCFFFVTYARDSILFVVKLKKRIVLHIEKIKIRYIMYDTHSTQNTSYIIYFIYSASHSELKISFTSETCVQSAIK